MLICIPSHARDPEHTIETSGVSSTVSVDSKHENDSLHTTCAIEASMNEMSANPHASSAEQISDVALSNILVLENSWADSDAVTSRVSISAVSSLRDASS